jgi:hypothetical protein
VIVEINIASKLEDGEVVLGVDDMLLRDVGYFGWKVEGECSTRYSTVLYDLRVRGVPLSIKRVKPKNALWTGGNRKNWRLTVV